MKNTNSVEGFLNYKWLQVKRAVQLIQVKGKENKVTQLQFKAHWVMISK